MHPDFTICLKSGWVVVNRGLNRDSVTGALKARCKISFEAEYTVIVPK